MAIRFYIIPEIGAGTASDPRRPKYVGLEASPHISWGGMQYANEAIYLVRADVTGAQHTSISGESDVLSAPENLQDVVGGTLTNLQNKLEAVNIPADWITAGMTYAEVIRWVARLFWVLQRFQGMGFGTFFESEDLDTLVGDMPQQKRSGLKLASESLGLDTDDIQGTDTIRVAFKKLTDQVTTDMLISGQVL